MRALYAGLCLLCCLSACAERPVEVQTRALGRDEFTPAAWAAAGQLARGRMTASFLEKHPPQELTIAQVTALLGDPTGYADYDEDPAYFVGPDSVRSEYGKGYLLIFISDRNTGRIKEVRIVPSVRN